MLMNRIFKNIDMYSRLLVLLVIIAGMALIKPSAFWNYSNISTVMFQQAPFTILMSFGMTLAIITKGIDKSMGSILVLSNALCGIFFKNGQYFIGLLIAIVVGCGCGAINGTLITRVGVAPFIATYGVDFVALGLAFVFSNGTYVYGFPDAFRTITNGQLIPGIPNIAFITLLIFGILYFVTKKTTFGRSVYSAGSNYNATTLSGITAKNIVLIVYVINGLLASITGILYMSRLNAGDVNISGNFTLDSIAATLIGGTSFGGGKGSVGNTVIGALIIVFIRNGMNVLNISTNWQSTVVGAIIILSVFYEMLINKISSRFKAAESGNDKEIKKIAA